MYHELYIDVFFLENLMMDSLLLLSLDHILKCGRPRGRIFLGGALGSLLTCAAVAVPFPGIVKLILFHVFINSIMIATALGIRSMGQFVRAYLLLYAVSVALGGLMALFRPYMRYVSLFYCGAFASWLLLIKGWSVLSRMTQRQRSIIPVTLYTARGEMRASALWDTGNRLRDFVTDAPVNVIDPAFLQKITECVEGERGFHMIPYRCVGGERVMKVFRIEKMCVHTDSDRWIADPLFGVGEETVSDDGKYDIILNPEIFCE